MFTKMMAALVMTGALWVTGDAATQNLGCCFLGSWCCGVAEECCTGIQSTSTAVDCCSSGASCCTPAEDCCVGVTNAPAKTSCCSETK